MADHGSQDKSGGKPDDNKPPEKKQPEKGRGKQQKKEEPKADSGPPKPGQKFSVYKLVAMKPVEGPDGWIVKVDVYHSPPEKEFLGVHADVEVLDGGVTTSHVEKFGKIINLPYQRHDRTVQFSVVKLWQREEDYDPTNEATLAASVKKAINPDVHTDQVFLPGQPYERLKPRVIPRPGEGFWKTLSRGLLGME